MERSRRKTIERHLSEERIDRLLREAEDEHRLRRLGFVKNLYRGDSVPEAAVREGRSAATGDRWADAWNEGGVDGLMPSFGGGRPSKLDDDERDELIALLREGQPWQLQGIQRLLSAEFGVEYHPDYLRTFLRDLGLSYAKSPPSRMEESTDLPGGDPRGDNERDTEGGWVVDEDVRADGGATVGALDAPSIPRTHDGSDASIPRTENGR